MLLKLVVSTCFGLGSLLYGAYCLVVSSWAVETLDGYFIRLFHTTYKIDDRGLLGDDGTFRAELTLEGLFFVAVSFATFIYTAKVMKTRNREELNTQA